MRLKTIKKIYQNAKNLEHKKLIKEYYNSKRAFLINEDNSSEDSKTYLYATGDTGGTAISLTASQIAEKVKEDPDKIHRVWKKFKNNSGMWGRVGDKNFKDWFPDIQDAIDNAPEPGESDTSSVASDTTADDGSKKYYYTPTDKINDDGEASEFEALSVSQIVEKLKEDPTEFAHKVWDSDNKEWITISDSTYFEEDFPDLHKAIYSAPEGSSEETNRTTASSTDVNSSKKYYYTSSDIVRGKASETEELSASQIAAKVKKDPTGGAHHILREKEGGRWAWTPISDSTYFREDFPDLHKAIYGAPEGSSEETNRTTGSGSDSVSGSKKPAGNTKVKEIQKIVGARTDGIWGRETEGKTAQFVKDRVTSMKVDGKDQRGTALSSAIDRIFKDSWKDNIDRVEDVVYVEKGTAPGAAKVFFTKEKYPRLFKPTLSSYLEFLKFIDQRAKANVNESIISESRGTLYRKRYRRY